MQGHSLGGALGARAPPLLAKQQNCKHARIIIKLYRYIHVAEN